jgi:hypothetical protein
MVSNLLRDTYLYGQALDNSGDAEYWCIQDFGYRYDRLETGDSRSGLIRKKIDEVMARGRILSLETEEIECRASLTGSCVVTIRPETTDVDGRVSPVLMLFNIYSGKRSEAVAPLHAIPDLMGRQLGYKALKGLGKLQKILGWPRLVIFLALFLQKKSK